MSRFSEFIGGGDGFRLHLVLRPKSKFFQLEIRRREGTKWKTTHSSLGTTDMAVAKAQAFALMAAMVKKDPTVATPAKMGRPSAREKKPETTGGKLTLGRVVELYLASTKFAELEKGTQDQYKLAFEVCLDFRDPRTGKRWRELDPTWLDQETVDAFTKARIDGTYEHPRIRPGYGGATTVRNYYVGLKAACMWAYLNKSNGKRMLPDRVWDGIKLPVETNLHQPVMKDDWFEKLLALSEKPWPYNRDGTRHFKLMLLMGEAFGNRANGILNVRWEDIDFRAKTLTWSEDFDKMGKERMVPIPDDVLDELRFHRDHPARQGSPWVFYARIAKGKAIAYDTALSWLIKAFPIALGIEKPYYLGYHSLRRKWKTDRGDMPLKAVMQAGGWSSVDSAMRYDKPPMEALKEVIEHGRRRTQRGGTRRQKLVAKLVAPYEADRERRLQVLSRKGVK